MTPMLRRSIACACAPFTAARNALHPGIRILMYHRVVESGVPDQLAVSPAQFERQIAALVRRYRVLALADAVDALQRGALEEGAVAVTFDDGYLDNLLRAVPVLERYGVPATIFVTTGFCDQQLRHPRYAPSAERLHLDWSEVRDLAARPGITIGSHTRTHPYLQQLDDASATREIARSRDDIEARVGRRVDFFCYPSGDMSAREVRLAREAGYRAAVTVAPGANRPGVDLHALHRTEMTDRDDPLDLALKLHGAYDPMHALLHRRRRARFARAAEEKPQ